MRLLIVFLCFSIYSNAQHPIAFDTQSDFVFIKKNLSSYTILKNSYEEVKQSVDAWLGKDVDVPLPKDAQGGYTHDRHKENYMLIFNGGLLFNLTGDKKYALLVKNMLLKYARLNPTLQTHPLATRSSPGHIFWQALNDANWLVYAALGYDLIYNSLSVSERKLIEDGAFKPEVEFITRDLESWFNLIHNQAVWGCAGIGIAGIVLNNQDYINKALYGTKGDGKSGLMALMDQLFSPDGYYTEGPYYARYAILPFYLFANALDHIKPQLKIFQYHNQLLRKALVSVLQQTNIDGRFFPVNDAMKDKDFTTNELVTAIAIARNVYGRDSSFLPVAKQQSRVLLHKGGVMVAMELNQKNISSYYPYTSVEYTDGANGLGGGISFLRSGKGPELSTLGFEYASHGKSHGQYDQLGIFLYDEGKEILQEYGSVRFVGIEQKYGGRYLPENQTYAAQSIAHNTIVVDETSHFNSNEAEAEKYHGEKLFSDISHPDVQVVSATQENAYSDVKLYRTLFMLRLPDNKKPLIIDMCRAESVNTHQYDLPFQFNGTVINTSFRYHPFTSSLETLGKNNGYQFLWKEAEAKVADTTIRFTFMNGNSYYSISSLVTDPSMVYFTRTGANDPDFNLRREPAFIIRKNGKSQNFISVIEMHGRYDPVGEFSINSYPSVQRIELVRSDDAFTIAEIIINGELLQVLQCNTDFSNSQKHNISYKGNQLSWTGPYTVLYDGKKL